MTNLSKTAAIAQATRCVDMWGSGTSWTINGPYHDDDPSGPSTDVTADSYHKARIIRARWTARVAVALMDLPSDPELDIERYFDDWSTAKNVRDAVDYAIEQARHAR